MKARVECRANGCSSHDLPSTRSRAQISAKCCTPWPQAIRDPRLSSRLLVEETRLVPLDRKTRHGLNLVNFFIFHHVVSRSRRGGRRGRSRDWPSHGCCNGGTRRTGILVAILERTRRARVERTNGNPQVFPYQRTWKPPRQLPRSQRKHVEPGCSVHGPGKWTSFGASSLDQLGLFCFLNTHRCSGSILYFFYFFIFFSPPLSLALSYVLHHPRKAAVYSSHVFIYHSFFFFSFSLPPLSSDEPRDDHRSLHGLTSCYTHCRTQAYILLLHYSSMRIYVFSLYIYTCIHTITTTSFAYIYI